MLVVNYDHHNQSSSRSSSSSSRSSSSSSSSRSRFGMAGIGTCVSRLHGFGGMGERGYTQLLLEYWKVVARKSHLVTKKHFVTRTSMHGHGTADKEFYYHSYYYYCYCYYYYYDYFYYYYDYFYYFYYYCCCSTLSRKVETGASGRRRHPSSEKPLASRV